VEDRVTKIPADALAKAVSDECLQRGLSMNIVRSIGGILNCFRMAPPLSVTEREIDIAIEIIHDSLTTVLASRSSHLHL
jgi:2,2-dialkylglycine decarboxylase (pyruvate)